MLHQNFAYILEKKADLHPVDIALIDGQTWRRYSYLELLERSCRFAQALLDRGLGKGDRICCLTNNSVEYIDAFMASSRLGVTLCPINYRLSVVEMKTIIKDCDPKAILFDAEFSEKVKAIVDEFPGIQTVVSYGNKEFAWASGLETITAEYNGSAPEIVSGSDLPLLMLYTAGSTGRPKGVPLRQSNLLFNALNWIIELGISKNDYTLTVLPLFHIGGHMLWTLPHLIVGAKNLLLKRFDAEKTLQLIEKEKVTNTYLIPAMAKMVVALPEWGKYDLSSVRFVGSGGEAVSDRIKSSFGEIGIPVLNSYGLTETSDGTTTIRPYAGLDKPANCIGKPLTFVDMKIVNHAGEEIKPHEEGEILHRGPSVVSGYWNRPEETAKAFKDGWFFSGDKATRDQDGYVYFLGRKDDMIVTGGENVYPTEVEEVILGHSEVADVAVLGVPDEKWGQTIKAVICFKKGKEVGEKEIFKYLEDKLSGFKKPRIIEIVDQLPKIGSGKLDRTLIRKTYGKQSNAM